MILTNQTADSTVQHANSAEFKQVNNIKHQDDEVTCKLTFSSV